MSGHAGATGALLSEAGLLTLADAGCGLILQATDRTRERTRAWDRVVSALRQGQRPDRPGAAVLLSLIARDAVVEHDALNAICSGGTTWHDDTAVYAEWVSPDGRWQDRRQLSAHTAKLVCSGWPQIARADWEALARWAARRMGGELAPARLEAVLGAAAAWWSQQLPPMLMLHVLGLRRLQLLPRSAHARRVACVQLPTSDGHRCEDDGIAGLLHAAHGLTPRTDVLQDIVHLVREAARQHRSGDGFRRRVLDGLMTIAPRACQAGRVQAMMLGGTYSIVAEGGARGELLGRRSLAGYVGVAVLPLGRALIDHGADPISLDEEGWKTVLDKMLEPLTGEPRAKALAYLQAFARFVLARGGMQLPLSRYGTPDESYPYARIAWPHEVDDAVAWIAARRGDDELRRQAMAALLVMATRPARPEEVSVLRVRDVVDHGSGLSLASAPLPSDGVGKSLAMRQIQRVTNVAAVEALLDIRAHRRRQHAADAAYLFGSPMSPQAPWRWAETMNLVQEALRAASGDPTLTAYALRHAVVSQAMETALMPGRTIDDFQSIAQISSLAGHEHVQSSRPYVNLIERPLAAWARSAVPDDGPVALGGFAHVAAGLATRERSATQAPDHDARARIDTAADGPSLDKVLAVLQEHAEQRELETIAYRHLLAVSMVQSIVQEAGHLLRLAGLLPRRGGTHPAAVARLVAAHGAWWSATDEPKLRGVRRLLDDLPTPQAAACVRAFLECARPRSIALDEPVVAAPLVEVLQRAAAEGSMRLVIRHADPHLPPMVRHWAVGEAEVTQIAPRPGEPRVRLLVAEGGTAAGCRGRGVSVHGLYGILIALGIRSELERRDRGR